MSNGKYFLVHIMGKIKIGLTDHTPILITFLKDTTFTKNKETFQENVPETWREGLAGPHQKIKATKYVYFYLLLNKFLYML